MGGYDGGADWSEPETDVVRAEQQAVEMDKGHGESEGAMRLRAMNGARIAPVYDAGRRAARSRGSARRASIL